MTDRIENLVFGSKAVHDVFADVDDETEVLIRSLVEEMERCPFALQANTEACRKLYMIGYTRSTQRRHALREAMDFVTWLRDEIKRRRGVDIRHPAYDALQATVPGLEDRLKTAETALYDAALRLYPTDDHDAIRFRIDAFFPDLQHSERTFTPLELRRWRLAVFARWPGNTRIPRSP